MIAHRIRRRLRATIPPAAAVAVLAISLLSATPASADTLTVGTTAESWYLFLPTCTAEVLCSPEQVPPVSPFPPGTLHVGLAAGGEVTRAYVKLDLDDVPSDAQLVGGTLTLPVAAEPAAGTLNMEQALINVCFMVRPFGASAAGSAQAPSAPDCFTSSPATLVVLEGGSSFVTDLAPFAERWAAGEPNEGLALVGVPDPNATLPQGISPSTWHVAFNGRDSAAAQKVAATLDYVSPVAEPPPPSSPVPPVAIPPVPGQAVPGAQTPAVQPPPQAFQPTLPVQTVALRGFEYAGVFMIPLVGMALVAMIAYSLTRDVVVPGRPADISS